MPVAFDSSSNTSMLLDVAGSVLSRRPVEKLTFPSQPPAAFGIMSCDGAGNLGWLAQYVSALTPDPSYNYFFTGSLDVSGDATLAPDRPLLLRPYDSRVVYALHLICRTFDASHASAIFVQGSVAFDPSQPLTSQWTADISDVYGDTEGFQATLVLTRVLPRGVSVTLQISSSITPNVHLDADMVIYYPIKIPK